MWKKVPYKGCVYFSLVLNIVLVATILASLGFLPPVVPLFYGLPIGAEQLVPALGLMLIPAIGFIVTFVNIFISSLTNDIFLKRTLIISCAFVSLLLCTTVVKIILLVGFF